MNSCTSEASTRLAASSAGTYNPLPSPNMPVRDEEIDHDDLRRRMANGERWQHWVDAIDEFDRAGRGTKVRGSRNGPIGYVGMALARSLAELFDENGICRSSPDNLADDVLLSRSAAQSALERLRTSGFVEYHPGARGRLAIFRIAFPKQVRS